MVIGYHVVFTTYGTWLPNDPRGSYSKKVYRGELQTLGEIEYGRQAPGPKNEELRRYWTVAAGRLERAPFFIDEKSRGVIAGAFGRVVHRLGVTVAACAIMNDHVHLFVLRSKYRIEYTVNQLKGGATHALEAQRTVWSRGFWKEFISDDDRIGAVRKYIEANPIDAGLGEQSWEFVRGC